MAGSHIYRTRPIGLTDQPDFQNAVARLSTTLAPEALLDELLGLEARFGRVREVRFGPRTLDLDLLWYEGVVRDDERLTLPHPRAHEREFVLRPLAELDPDLDFTAPQWPRGSPGSSRRASSRRAYPHVDAAGRR